MLGRHKLAKYIGVGRNVLKDVVELNNGMQQKTYDRISEYLDRTPEPRTNKFKRYVEDQEDPMSKPIREAIQALWKVDREDETTEKESDAVIEILHTVRTRIYHRLGGNGREDNRRELVKKTDRILAKSIATWFERITDIPLKEAQKEETS